MKLLPAGAVLAALLYVGVPTQTSNEEHLPVAREKKEDVTGDGIEDILREYRGAGMLWIDIQRGRPTLDENGEEIIGYEPPTTIGYLPIGSREPNIHIRDIDRDGYPDLIVELSEDVKLEQGIGHIPFLPLRYLRHDPYIFLINNGTGHFTQQSLPTPRQKT